MGPHKKITAEEWLKTESYNYTLPPELIATEPARPKENSRLMVIERKSGRIIHTRFRNILSFIPAECGVVYNDTKVIKARLFGKKTSGGKIELLVNKEIRPGYFNVLIRGKVKAGTTIIFDETLRAKIVELLEDGSRAAVFLDAKKRELRFEELFAYLERLGHMPLPPYIDREDTEADVKLYQSVFAKQEGAVAAPTASLHFSDRLFSKLSEMFETLPVTLHVGAGTFKPVETEKITDHQIHSEYYEIPASTARLIDSKKKILAIGTTVTRTVEHYARTAKRSGECDLFLHPGNPPVRIDYLLTNFHLPKSTLIMLVASFLGLQKTLKVYNEAIKNRYRFYSYGDAMLIL